MLSQREPALAGELAEAAGLSLDLEELGLADPGPGVEPEGGQQQGQLDGEGAVRREERLIIILIRHRRSIRCLIVFRILGLLFLIPHVGLGLLLGLQPDRLKGCPPIPEDILAARQSLIGHEPKAGFNDLANEAA